MTRFRFTSADWQKQSRPVMRTLSSRCDGFTLIETLFAMSLASVIAVTVLTWVGNERALATRLETDANACVAAQHIERLLSDDILQSLSFDGHRMMVDGANLRMFTMNHAGDDVPGARIVVWSFDTAQGLVLRSQQLAGGSPDSRIVTRHLAHLHFAGDGDHVVCTWKGERERSFHLRFARIGEN